MVDKIWSADEYMVKSAQIETLPYAHATSEYTVGVHASMLIWRTRHEDGTQHTLLQGVKQRLQPEAELEAERTHRHRHLDVIGRLTGRQRRINSQNRDRNKAELFTEESSAW